MYENKNDNYLKISIYHVSHFFANYTEIQIKYIFYIFSMNIDIFPLKNVE